MKKGWCPTLLNPMETGDGWLVRINIMSGKLAPQTACAIAALSTQYGNGQMDLTSRGNLQLRGVAKQQCESLAQALMGLGLSEEVRNPRDKTRIDVSLGYENNTLALGLLFGRISAPALTWLADQSKKNIGLSGARVMYLYNVSASNAPNLLAQAAEQGFIIHSNDPRRKIEACPGAPACSSAQGDTRNLALAIANASPNLSQTIHISGCDKGCACSVKTDIMVTANNGAYDLAFNATVKDAPMHHSLSGQAIVEFLGDA